MTVIDLISNHPLLAGFVVLVAFHYGTHLLSLPLRAMNIRRHGWPPEHCDADGDHKRPRCRDCDE